MTSEDENEDPDGGSDLLLKAKKKKLGKKEEAFKPQQTSNNKSGGSVASTSAPVTCKECGKTFKKQSNLQLHIEKVRPVKKSKFCVLLR